MSTVAELRAKGLLGHVPDPIIVKSAGVGYDFDLKLSDDQIKVGKWIDEHDGHDPDDVLHILLQNGNITLEKFLSEAAKSDLEKIEFLESLNKTTP
jgi:hypothetical protein